ncbi:MAG: hypothetical protein L0287_34620 [Anaerolineae bacterium]|nr:hypothetical protein [Anaerolineae bacterium]
MRLLFDTSTLIAALIFYAAVKAGADQLLTLNPRHFRQIYPGYADRVVEPLKADQG